jgi:hypothetical protein
VDRVLKPSRPALVVAAAVAVTLAFSAVAVAGAPYTVSVHVKPKTVPLHKTFKVTASGVSANTSLLRVFLNHGKGCAASPVVESTTAGDVLVIKADVTHAYSKSKVVTAQLEGNHFACAYLSALPPSPLQRGHASAHYSVG